MFECNPSRAHHEVECSRPAPFEGDPDAARVLRDPGNGVVEDILDVVLGGGVQDANEVTAQNLDVGDHASRVAEAVGIHDGLPLVGAIDVGHAARAGVRLPDLGHDAHALDHVPGRATNVDRLAARPWSGCSLHYGGVEAVAAQPVRQRWPSYARAGDEYVEALHWGH